MAARAVFDGLVSVVLRPEIVDYFRATGPGWQARVDDALMEVAARPAEGVAGDGD